MRAVNFQAASGPDDFQRWSEEALREIERASRDFDPNALDFLGTPAQGDVIYRGAANWARLPAGTSGYVLSTLGASANPLWVPRREILSADRTYYVRPNGSDSNTGLADTAGGAKLTLQGTYDAIASSLDFGGKTVSIQAADATYAPLSITTAWVGGGNLTIRGNAATPANVVISGGAASAIKWSVPLPGLLTVKDYKLVTNAFAGFPLTGSIHAFSAGSCEFTNIDFGQGSLAHIFAQAPGASISATGNYGISGGAFCHYFVTRLCQADTQQRTVTLTGTPAFPGSYARAEGAGAIAAFAMTFSGAATGPRYFVDNSSVINTSGGGPNYFPGNSAGSGPLGNYL